MDGCTNASSVRAFQKEHEILQRTHAVAVKGILNILVSILNIIIIKRFCKLSILTNFNINLSKIQFKNFTIILIIIGASSLPKKYIGSTFGEPSRPSTPVKTLMQSKIFIFKI